MGLSERFNAISEFIANKGAGRQKESAFDVETQQAVKAIIAEVRKRSGDPGTDQLFRDYKTAMGMPDRTRRTSFIGTRQHPSHLYRLLTTGVSLSLLLAACGPSPAVAAGESSGGTAPTAQSTRTTESKSTVPVATRTPEATTAPETPSSFYITALTAGVRFRDYPSTTGTTILGSTQEGDVLHATGQSIVATAGGTSMTWYHVDKVNGEPFNGWVAAGPEGNKYTTQPKVRPRLLTEDGTPADDAIGGPVKQDATPTATRAATATPTATATAAEARPTARTTAGPDTTKGGNQEAVTTVEDLAALIKPVTLGGTKPEKFDASLPEAEALAVVNEAFISAITLNTGLTTAEIHAKIANHEPVEIFLPAQSQTTDTGRAPSILGAPQPVSARVEEGVAFLTFKSMTEISSWLSTNGLKMNGQTDRRGNSPTDLRITNEQGEVVGTYQNTRATGLLEFAIVLPSGQLTYLASDIGTLPGNSSLMLWSEFAYLGLAQIMIDTPVTPGSAVMTKNLNDWGAFATYDPDSFSVGGTDVNLPPELDRNSFYRTDAAWTKVEFALLGK